MVDALRGSTGFLEGLKRLCKEGRLVEALQTATFMNQQGVYVPAGILYCLLQGCINWEDLAVGRKVHRFIVRNGFESDIFLMSHVIRMFATCGSLPEANEVFHELSKHNVFTWCAIIAGHTKFGQFDNALKLYHQMWHSCVEPDGHVFAVVLKACASTLALAEGMIIHSHVTESSFQLDGYVVNALMNMYAKCGSLEDASRVFDILPKPDVVTWSTLIAEYVQHGKAQEALLLYQQMLEKGTKPDIVIFSSILKACSNVLALNHGKTVHAHFINTGVESDMYVENGLIDMYVKCGSLADARKVFDISNNQDVVTWSAIISGYAQHGDCQETFQLLALMQNKGLQPNHVTFACMLKGCSNSGTLDQGNMIHIHIIENGFDSDAFIGSSLINMYANCGSLENAHKVFSHLARQSVVEWSAIISGYSMHGLGREAFHLFGMMQEDGVMPDRITFVSILKACSSSSTLAQAKLINLHIAICGFESDAFVGGALIDMYAKCGSIEDALIVFDNLPDHDVVAQSAMIAGCAEFEQGQEALHLFHEMQQDGIEPNQVAFVCVLKACSSIAALDQGKLIHSSVTKIGFELDAFLGSAYWLVCKMWEPCRCL